MTAPAKSPAKTLTVDDVAQQLHVKPATVALWASADPPRLRGSKVGRRWLFVQEDVDALVESMANTVRPSARRRRRRAA
jgi:excisionase family DNA binding protein